MITDVVGDVSDQIVTRDASTATKLIATLAIIVIAWLLNRMIDRYLLGHVEDPKSQYWARKGKTYVVVSVTFIAIWLIWIAGLRSIATFLGLLAAGLAIALKEPLENMAGWLFIISRRPFKIGDRIQIDEFIGDVADLRVFQFSILEIGNWVDADQMTGRIIHIPNGWVFHKAQMNYVIGLSFIFDEIPVLVTFESDWEKAKAVLEDIVHQHSVSMEEIQQARAEITESEFMVDDYGLGAMVYTSVEDSGVMLAMRYICDPKERRRAAQDMWESVLHEFAKHPDIDLAYPTTRFYSLNEDQPPPGTRPPERVQITRNPTE